MLLNIKKSTPNYMVYCELGTTPLINVIKHRMINYWSRLAHNNDNRLNYILYNLLFRKYLQERTEVRWLSFIRSILNDCGLSYVQNEHLVTGFNEKWLNLTVKQTLSDQHLQNIISDIDSSSKASCYKIFKDNIEFEEYLDILCEKDRHTLCKFRTTNHRLIIETGRWHKIERSDRVCNLCNQGLVGDEFHYLLECSSLYSERKDLLGNEFCIFPTIYKFKKLLSTKDINLLQKLFHFIRIIFTKASYIP